MPSIAVVAAVLVFCTVRLVARRSRSKNGALTAVATELRRPMLPFFPSVRPRTLPLQRFGSRLRTPPGRGVAVTKHHVGDPTVQILVTRPAQQKAPLPAVLWIHSGGMVLGSAQLELSVIGRLARDLDAVVVSPNYRLAPEHPFPAALEDCMASLRWMRAHGDELGIDPDRIAVAGASAGGGLSAAVAQRSHDEGVPLRAQALVYPMLDDRTALRDDHIRRGHFVWTPNSNLFGWTALLGRPPRMSDAPEYAAPARRTDLRNLPPTWIGVGELDLLYDEAIAYAETLRACGVPCEMVTVPGMYHGADAIAPKATSMQEFRRSMVTHLLNHL